jgi:hypothetical protein
MAKKSAALSKSPSLPVSESSGYEPTAEEINALVRQSHGGISRRMARLILIQRHAN